MDEKLTPICFVCAAQMRHDSTIFEEETYRNYQIWICDECDEEEYLEVDDEDERI